MIGPQADRHPYLRYRRSDTAIECRLRGDLIARAAKQATGRWCVFVCQGGGWSDMHYSPTDEKALLEMARWARKVAWKRFPRCYATATSKALRKRPTFC